MSTERFVTKSGESWNWCRAGDVGMSCEGQKGWKSLWSLHGTLDQTRGTEQWHCWEKQEALGYSCWRWEYFSSHLVLVNVPTPEAFRALSEQRSYSSSHSFTSYVPSQEENTPGEMLGILIFHHIAQGWLKKIPNKPKQTKNVLY